MKKVMRFFSLSILILCVVPAHATSTGSSTWDSVTITPTDRWDNDWDNHAIEGQSCSEAYHGRQCAPGLACEYYAGASQGICRRVCSSHRECGFGEFCNFKGYGIGVCRSDYDRGGYPNDPAMEGERCSRTGYHYPKCDYDLICEDRNGDGIAICTSGRHYRRSERRY